MPELDERLLTILGNPNHPDRPPFRLEGDLLICTLTGDRYPIKDGIPQLLPEDRIEEDRLVAENER